MPGPRSLLRRLSLHKRALSLARMPVRRRTYLERLCSLLTKQETCYGHRVSSNISFLDVSQRDGCTVCMRPPLRTPIGALSGAKCYTTLTFFESRLAARTRQLPTT